MDDFVERKAATEAVIGWIVAERGEPAASTWAWECTPIPCGLPSDRQLDEGLRIATGELDLREHVARCYAEMDEQMAAYEAGQHKSVANGNASRGKDE